MNLNQKDRRGISKRRRRHRNLVKLYLAVFVLSICLLSVLALKEKIKPEDGEGNLITSLANIDSNIPEVEKLSNGSLDLQNLTSKDAMLSELTSGITLGEKNSQDRVYPASLTKIMTAILAIEHTPDMNQTMTLPSDIFPDLYAQNASMAGFQPGEEVRFEDLLYGVLLPSGAECCLGFSDYIAGSESAFVDLMNEKAEELGMRNTHFCNSTGLHDEDHYTTVEDISILLRYALKNEEFRAVFTSTSHSTQPTNRNPQGITFQSTMFKNLEDSQVPNGEILGGKTGYTQEAGLCLASLALVDNKEYILVTAGADGTHQTRQFNILDAVNVYSQIGNLDG